jgi:hypothetical protein
MRSIVLLLIGFITSAQAQTGAVSPTASPWQVKGVTVVLSGTTGFSRDMALEQAARQALLQVLQNPLGLSAAEAAAKARAVGEALRFVSRYQIVQEAVLPSYSLKADLTFNEAMLRKNFGGVVAPVAVSNTAAVAPGTAASPATGGSAQSYIVRVPEPSAAGQDRARRALAALPDTRVTYRLISGQGIELNVQSAQPEQALRSTLAGWQPEIRPAEPEAKLGVTEPATPEPVATEPKAAVPPTPPASRRPAWLPDLW